MYSLEAGERKGRPPPDWFIEQPFILPYEQFYVTAFMRLHTDRPMGIVEGPIPWGIRVAYGERAGLDGDMVNIFADIIGVIDTIYLEDRAKREKEETDRRAAQASKPKKGKLLG